MADQEQGYVIMAIDHATIDYVACAEQLATSLRDWHPDVEICLITDRRDYANDLFDHVREIVRSDPSNGWAEDWQVFFQTPFRETVKLEADMLITSPIDHWWHMFRHRDVIISTGCRDWRGNVSSQRQYRKTFDVNGLPDVYNAITYWRRSQLARDFFVQVRDIFQNWQHWQRTIRYADTVPSTDLVYAMAAQLIGPDLVTLPFASYPRMVHMKRHHAGTAGEDWTHELIWEKIDRDLRIQTRAQWGAFHYHVKDWQP